MRSAMTTWLRRWAVHPARALFARPTLTDMRARKEHVQKWGALGAFTCILGASLQVAYATHTPDPDSMPDQPPDFKYVNMWTSKDGQTHISECEMKGFILKSFASKGAPQYVRLNDLKVVKTSFTQLPPGTVSGLHSPPGMQFVVDMAGSWYVETTDGTRREFQPGEVLFQDNVEKSPAEKQPQHGSGTVGDVPCNQFVIQVDRAPEVDRPCPF